MRTLMSIQRPKKSLCSRLPVALRTNKERSSAAGQETSGAKNGQGSPSTSFGTGRGPISSTAVSKNAAEVVAWGDAEGSPDLLDPDLQLEEQARLGELLSVGEG